MTTITTSGTHRPPSVIAVAVVVTLAAAVLLVISLLVADDGPSTVPARASTSADAVTATPPSGSADSLERRAQSERAPDIQRYGSADAAERQLQG